MMKNSKGITLTTLIITIIILLILASVAIDLSIDGKITESAQSVVNKSEEQMNQHQEMADEVRNLYK